MLTRRHAVKLSAKGVAALMASLPHLSGCARHARQTPRISPRLSPSLTASKLSWTEFIEALASLADGQFTAGWSQEQHVEEVMALMRLVDLDDAKFEQVYDGYVSARGLFPEIGSIHHGGHFSVASLEFDPGDEIRLHNHPDMTGVILCLTGSVEVEAFNLLDAPSPTGKLLIEQVTQVQLKPGSFATLTADHGNIHRLVATEFTELLDVFTPPYDAERMRSYRWYERSEEPIRDGIVFEAWET